MRVFSRKQIELALEEIEFDELTPNAENERVEVSRVESRLPEAAKGESECGLRETVLLLLDHDAREVITVFRDQGRLTEFVEARGSTIGLLDLAMALRDKLRSATTDR